MPTIRRSPSGNGRRTRGVANRIRCADVLCAVMVVSLAIGTCGCRTLGSRRGPSAQSVATCRQLTEQGIGAMERGDWKRAETLLARAVEASPADPDARRQYAEALWHRGELKEALVQLQEARRLVSTDPALAVRAGEVYLRTGQVSQARAMADEALTLDPKFAPAWTLRGRVAGAAGQQRQALADYQRSLGYSPGDRDVAILVAETYRQLNEPERALLTLQAAGDEYARGEEPQQVLYLEGLALAALGRYDEAARSLAQAARVDRPTSEILCHLAEVELLSGNLAKAHASVEEALAIDPNHAASRALWTRMAAAHDPQRPIAR